MGKKRHYSRTAALLGPQERQVAVRPGATSKRKGARPSQAAGTPRVALSERVAQVPWKLVVPLLAVVALILWVVLGDAWYLMWEDLTVKGLSHPQLEQTIKVTADLLGYHRFDLKPREAEDALKAALPYFSDVTVHCGLVPASCEISVQERVPILVWLEGTNAHWVDGTGMAFPALADRPDLPVIRGALPAGGSAYTMTAILKGVAALAELGISVSELECTADRGLVWTDPEGRRVAFGAGSGMAERRETYQLMVEHFAQAGIAAQQLDVRFRDGITYTLGRSW